ncbi:hypothetical protein BOX15_Mlig023917g1 [Macrostomum lignano]|uniref:BBE domain-containing protein n=2 Tax=Macrostomum lignano TaxID=282301 RepID=A0A1I8GCV1_9PLAT|nr:hypothetical protein BOX15_Mlig023917g1 [Macrostomum lignano]
MRFAIINVSMALLAMTLLLSTSCSTMRISEPSELLRSLSTRPRPASFLLAGDPAGFFGNAYSWSPNYVQRRSDNKNKMYKALLASLKPNTYNPSDFRVGR